MRTRRETRDLIVVSMAGTGPAGDLDGLLQQGWRLWRAESASDILRLLKTQPRTCFAALLELRGADPRKTGSPPRVDHLMPVLTIARIGWVAGVTQKQLEQPWVRRLIHHYCHDYVTLPCASSLLGVVLGHAHGMAALSPDDGQEHAGSLDGDDMIGESPAMRTMQQMLQKAAMTEAPVYIAGETGTGKELAALAIHRRSARRERPFVVINCGAIPQSLMQSELFGYERGAFTGASQRKLGRIEMAHTGTLFLDEIGDLPMDSQASLLRFLQQGSIERLGGHEEIRIDVRILSATHVDLGAAVADGRFREDLYHRLRVIELRQPPLRERGGDIDLIAAHALSRHAAEATRRIRGFSSCARQAMQRYAWPGNVRELVNRVRQAVVMADGPCITARDLRLDGEDIDAPETLDAARCQGERAAIERALQRNGHRMAATARDLGVSRVTLYRLMARHGLRDDEAAVGAGRS
ncbi:sigma 54-interacting transcriptional regulator [Luteimonas sp. 22616]|uniref:sigma-54 dependent transcriptional regulator n=1 Tax=Luteimonas sp. 22616 TaxID=3453951 RepID=UPI003F839B03